MIKVYEELPCLIDEYSAYKTDFFSSHKRNITPEEAGILDAKEAFQDVRKIMQKAKKKTRS